MISGDVWLLIAVGVLAIAAAVCFPIGMVRSARDIRLDEPPDNTHDDIHGTVSTNRSNTPPNDIRR